MPILRRTLYCHRTVLLHFAVAAPYVTHAKLFAALPWHCLAKLYPCISLHCQCLAIHCHRYVLQNLTIPTHSAQYSAGTTLRCHFFAKASCHHTGHYQADARLFLSVTLPRLTPLHHCLALQRITFALPLIALLCPYGAALFKAFPRQHLALPCCTVVSPCLAQQCLYIRNIALQSLCDTKHSHS